MVAARDVGLDVVGLTDHDSAAGWDEAAVAAREAGVAFVPGMEISTKHDGAGVHLLAYLPDPTYPPLVDELTKILAGRTGRLSAMVGQLQAAGVDITEQEVLDQVGASPGHRASSHRRRPRRQRGRARPHRRPSRTGSAGGGPAT